MFIENTGQWAVSARFQVRGGSSTMWLAEDALWLTIVKRSADDTTGGPAEPSVRFAPDGANVVRQDESQKAANIKVSFVGANPHPRIEPFDPLDTVVSYFIGRDPDTWRPDVPAWGGVRYVDLYPGVDLELTSEGGQMVQRLAARPGSDLSGVKLRVEGADNVTTDGDALRLSTAAGEVDLPLLKANGVQVAGLKLQPRGVQAFDISEPFAQANSSGQSDTPESVGHAVPQGRLAASNPQSLADNPADLLYGTFLGSSITDEGWDIAVDRAGSAYVTGWTNSTDFPTTLGAFDSSFNGVTDAFVIKLNPAGSGLVYATFLGGSDVDDYGRRIAVDGAGSAYVTGETGSSDFATTPGAFDTSYNDGYDAFVVKLNPTGSGLVYATFLGGSGSEGSWGIAADGAGSAYVTGSTSSSDFPTKAGAWDTSYSGGDAFVVKLNSAGSGLAYATFLGGSGSEGSRGIAVDGTGSAYVIGETGSTDFPSTPGAFDASYNGGDIYGGDAFVVKLNPAGSGLAYATFLGGSSSELGRRIAVDGAGSAYVTGRTGSNDFPTTPGAFDRSYNDGFDAFVVKLNPAGNGLAYATFLGGSGGEAGDGIAVDGAGSAYVTGWTNSTDFPTTPSAFDPGHNGYSDALVVKLNPAGSELAYATFLGGSDTNGDSGRGIAVDGAGNAYVTGATRSADFPTTSGAFDTSFNESYDAFAAKLRMPNVSITYVEVTQGIQCINNPNCFGDPSSSSTSQQLYDTHCGAGNPNCNNAIPLIAGRPAFVRVYVDCNLNCDTLPNSAELRAYGPSGELGPALAPFGGFVYTAGLTNQRGDLRRTLNFSPPTEWLTGQVTFRASVAGIIQDEIITFNPGASLRVAWVSMPYFPPQPVPPPDQQPIVWNPDETVARNGITDMLDLYPVSSDDVTYVFQPGFDIRMRQLFRCLPSSDCPAVTEYLTSLNVFWARLDREGMWVDGVRPDRLYGWVPDEAKYVVDDGYLCGISDPLWLGRAGRVAAGLDSCGAETLAHEIGHNFDSAGLLHAPGCGATGFDPDYPDLAGRIGEWGVGIASGSYTLRNPAATYDFMSYCSPEWISPYNYEKLTHGFQAVRAVAVLPSVASEQHQILASGTVYSPTITGNLDALFDVTSAVLPDGSTGTDYCLELRDAADTALDSRCFDLSFTNPESGEPTGADGFSYVLPYPEGTRAVVLTHLGTEVTRIAASNAVPTVQVLSPNGGENWDAGGTYIITWTGGDLDNDELHYAISLSTDGGFTWNPLVLDTTATEWSIDAGLLPGSGQARIRVQVSDGFNTAVDTSNAVFTIAAKGPQANMIAPQAGVTMTLGTPLWLQGSGSDLEDGTLTGAALAWSSNLEGPLATGGEVSVTLSEGQHTVTLTVTDSENNAATATVEVRVIEAISPEAPVVDIAWDENGLTLSWRHVVTDTLGNPADINLYQVWHSATPYFDAHTASSTGIEVPVPDGADSGTLISHTDTEAVTNPATSTYYFVRAISVVGKMSANSNRVTAFNFTLTPGTSP